MAEQNNQSGGWQQGLALFIQLSGWLAGPLIIALFLGQWLDRRFATEPWLFLLTTAIAFGITVFGISFQAIKYIKTIEEQLKNKKDIYKQVDNNDRTKNR